MLLADVVFKATAIEEDFNDPEVAHAETHDLYWTVLIAIATGRCEGGSPREFAAAVIGLEPSAAEIFLGVGQGAELRERIAGKMPAWLEAKYAPPPPAARKKTPPRRPPRKKPKRG